MTVSTKSAKSDKQYVWESEADSSSYIIREETDTEKIVPRGTVITLYLKVILEDTRCIYSWSEYLFGRIIAGNMEQVK